jgi:hypothetical protein
VSSLARPSRRSRSARYSRAAAGPRSSRGEAGVAQDAHEQVVEVVRDAAGEHAEALELLGGAQRLLGAPLLGERLVERALVPQPERAADEAPAFAADRRRLDPEPGVRLGQEAVEAALGRGLGESSAATSTASRASPQCAPGAPSSGNTASPSAAAARPSQRSKRGCGAGCSRSDRSGRRRPTPGAAARRSRGLEREEAPPVDPSRAPTSRTGRARSGRGQGTRGRVWPGSRHRYEERRAHDAPGIGKPRSGHAARAAGRAAPRPAPSDAARWCSRTRAR